MYTHKRPTKETYIYAREPYKLDTCIHTRHSTLETHYMSLLQKSPIKETLDTPTKRTYV